MKFTFDPGHPHETCVIGKGSTPEWATTTTGLLKCFCVTKLLVLYAHCCNSPVCQMCGCWRHLSFRTSDYIVIVFPFIWELCEWRAGSSHVTLWALHPSLCWYLSLCFSSLFRLIIRNFWSHETRLPSNTLDRLLALNSLYSPKIEVHFLSLATNFLLEMTRISPDYINPIFEHPLSECEFQVKCLSWWLLHVSPVVNECLLRWLN